MYRVGVDTRKGGVGEGSWVWSLCSLAPIPHGLGLVPERWGAGGRIEGPDRGAEEPISPPERQLLNYHRRRGLHRHSDGGW